MTVNITDVSVSIGAPANPYNKTKDGSKEDFMALLSGSAMNLSAANSSQNINKPDVNEIDTGYIRDNSLNNRSKVSIKSVANDNKADTQTVKEAIEDFTEAVKDKITEEFGVSEEQLTEAMEALGLSFLDLTQPKNLAMLLNELNGQDSTVNLLLDNSVKDIFDAMSEFTGDLFAETGLETEGLKEVFFGEVETVDAVTNINPEASLEQMEPIEDKSFVETVNTAIKAENYDGKAENNEKTPEVNADSEKTISGVIDSKITVNNNQSNSGNSMADSSANQNMNQNPEPVFANPENNFSNTIENFESTPEVPVYTDVNTADVIDQIVTQARVSITEQVKTMEMELNPQNLGRMIMQVSESEGQITARFFTQSDAVRAALETAIANLIEKLNEQGVKVDAVEVSVGTHEFEQNLEQNFANDARESFEGENEGKSDNRSRGGIHLGNPDYMEDAVLTEEEALTASMMRDQGNTINFKA